MGRVTFNGNVATVESQVYIRQEEQKLLLGPGDEFTKARKIELLYRENGLEPGSFYRAGSFHEHEEATPIRGIGVGWLIGFALIIIALILMKKFGLQ